MVCNLSLKKNRRLFTLLEIVISVAILSMVASVMGWQIHQMVGRVRFQKSMEKLILDLQKVQVIALSDRCDIKLIIHKNKKGYFYQVVSDEPIKAINHKRVALNGVSAIQRGSQQIDEMIIPIFSQGRIGLEDSVEFLHNGKQSQRLTFNPLCVGEK